MESKSKDFCISFGYWASCAESERLVKMSMSSRQTYEAVLREADDDFAAIARVAETHHLTVAKSTETHSRRARSGKRPGGGTGAALYGGFPPLLTETIGSYGITFGSAAVALAFIRAVRPLLEKWIESRANRTIEITSGKETVKMTGTNDLAKAHEAIEKLKKVAVKPRRVKKKTSKKSD